MRDNIIHGIVLMLLALAQICMHYEINNGHNLLLTSINNNTSLRSKETILIYEKLMNKIDHLEQSIKNIMDEHTTFVRDEMEFNMLMMEVKGAMQGDSND